MNGGDVYFALKHNQRLERPIHCPLFIYQIMLNCWQWDEKKRPNFDQLHQSLKIERSPYLLERRKSASIDENETNIVDGERLPSDHF